MIHRFKNLGDAVAWGYRVPVPIPEGEDEDTSGPMQFGYVYRDKSGALTVPVWLDEDYDEVKRTGVIVPLFPPK